MDNLAKPETTTFLLLPHIPTVSSETTVLPPPDSALSSYNLSSKLEILPVFDKHMVPLQNNSFLVVSNVNEPHAESHSSYILSTSSQCPISIPHILPILDPGTRSTSVNCNPHKLPISTGIQVAPIPSSPSESLKIEGFVNQVVQRKTKHPPMVPSYTKVDIDEESFSSSCSTPQFPLSVTSIFPSNLKVPRTKQVMSVSINPTACQNEDTNVSVTLFPCAICKIAFTSYVLVMKHMKIHEQERTYQCDYCRESFNQEVNAQVHVALFHRFPEPHTAVSDKNPNIAFPSISEFRCCICQAPFHDKNRLVAHLNGHRVDDQLPCIVCHKKFPSLSILRYHLITVHDSQCPPSSSGLQVDSTSHPVALSTERKCKENINSNNIPSFKEGQFICFICSEAFDDKKVFSTHMTGHESQRPYPCPHCTDGTAFNHADNLSIHCMIHHSFSLDTSAYKCTFCQQEYSRRSKFICHLQKHEIEEFFPCPRCGEIQLTSDLLNHHLQEHEYGMVMKQRERRHVYQAKDIASRVELFLPNSLGDVRKSKNKNPSTASFNRKFALVELNVLVKRKSFISNNRDQSPPQDETDVSKLQIIEKVPDTIDIRYTKLSKGFQCDECNQRFMKLSLLKRHSYKHTGYKPFKCPLCDKHFTQKPSAKVHLLTHKTNKIFCCDYCDKKFGYHVNCVAHMKKHLDLQRPKSKSCDHCGLYFKEKEMASHLQLQHNEVKLNLENEKKIKKSLPSTKKSKTHKCTELNREVYEKHSMTVRIEDGITADVYDGLMHTQIIGLTSRRHSYTCLVCHRRVKSRFEFIRHMRTHMNIRPFVCSFCNVAFTQASALKSHLRLHRLPLQQNHDSMMQWNCRVCAKILHSAAAYRLHMRLHTHQKPHQCSRCDRRFVSVTHCLYHERTAHLLRPPGMEPLPVHISGNDNHITETTQVLSETNTMEPSPEYRCAQCNRVYKYARHLKEHIQRVHETSARRACIYCNTTFANKSSLQRHIVACHLRVRQFSCEVCGRRFASKSDVARHKSVHESNNRFNCPICKKMFRTRALCRAHILIHSQQFALINTDVTIQDSSDLNQIRDRSQLIALESTNQWEEDCFDMHGGYDRLADKTSPERANEPLSDFGKLDSSNLLENIEQSQYCNVAEPLMAEEFDEMPILEAEGPALPTPVAPTAEHIPFHRYLFGCGKCEESFDNRDDLRHHLKQSHTRTPLSYSCAFCSFHDCKLEDVIKHMHTHRLGELISIFQCPLCPYEVFHTQHSLSRHAMEKHYIDTERYRCRHCGQGFAYIHRLATHIRTAIEAHTARRLAQSAPQGNSTLVIDNATAEHVARIKPSDRMSLSEKLLIETAKERIKMKSQLSDNLSVTCESMTTKPSHFQLSEVDMATNSNSHAKLMKTNGRHICPICSKGFSRPALVRRHMDIHTRLSHPFLCPHCGKQLSSRDMLTQHITQMHLTRTVDVAQSCLQCHICHRMMSTKRALRLHLAVHTGVKSFACPFCLHRFRAASQLKRHCQHKHNVNHSSSSAAYLPTYTVPMGQIPFSTSTPSVGVSEIKPSMKLQSAPTDGSCFCRLCYQVFSDFDLLTKHSCLHNVADPKKYCFACKKHFKTAQTMRQHVLLHRKSSQQYCLYCNKTFLYENSYRRHMLNHEQPYSWSCRTCKASFTAKASLKHHMATIHK